MTTKKSSGLLKPEYCTPKGQYELAKKVTNETAEEPCTPIRSAMINALFTVLSSQNDEQRKITQAWFEKYLPELMEKGGVILFDLLADLVNGTPRKQAMFRVLNQPIFDYSTNEKWQKMHLQKQAANAAYTEASKRLQQLENELKSKTDDKGDLVYWTGKFSRVLQNYNKDQQTVGKYTHVSVAPTDGTCTYYNEKGEELVPRRNGRPIKRKLPKKAFA